MGDGGEMRTPSGCIAECDEHPEGSRCYPHPSSLFPQTHRPRA